MTKLIILQTNVSQLDEPVYAEIANRIGPEFHVIYWNDYGLVRTKKDPETGLVPQFQEAHGFTYPRTWIDTARTDWWQVRRQIATLAPDTVILSDLPRLSRAMLSVSLRLAGVRTVLRSDKNALSSTARTGMSLARERLANKLCFSGLAAGSPLTRDYYAWPSSRPMVMFPYSTRSTKFAPDAKTRAEARARVRADLGIPTDARVFLSAAKFAERENPWGIFKSFETLNREQPGAYLVALGDGPLFGEIREYCAEQGIARVSFPGFVDFAVLQDYFFAADTFLHFPYFEPWGVSVQDALVAGLGMVAGDTVGSACHFLEGDAARYLVNVRDPAACAARMSELLERNDHAAPFAAAHLRARDYCSEQVADRLIRFAEAA